MKRSKTIGVRMVKYVWIFFFLSGLNIFLVTNKAQHQSIDLIFLRGTTASTDRHEKTREHASTARGNFSDLRKLLTIINKFSRPKCGNWLGDWKIVSNVYQICYENQFVSTLPFIWLIFWAETRKFLLYSLCGNILVSKVARGNFFTFLMSGRNKLINNSLPTN